MTEEQLEAWIKKCEGLNLETYIDTTGHLTVGWGRNLENGIRLDEAELMFQNDLKQTLQELEQCGWYKGLPSHIQQAMINMNFNLGIHKLSSFKKMIAALIAKNWTVAAAEALDSLWARQVGDRAKDIALIIREGE
jgi:lysozyme